MANTPSEVLRSALAGFLDSSSGADEGLCACKTSQPGAYCIFDGLPNGSVKYKHGTVTQQQQKHQHLQLHHHHPQQLKQQVKHHQYQQQQVAAALFPKELGGALDATSSKEDHSKGGDYPASSRSTMSERSRTGYQEPMRQSSRSGNPGQPQELMDVAPLCMDDALRCIRERLRHLREHSERTFSSYAAHRCNESGNDSSCCGMPLSQPQPMQQPQSQQQQSQAVSLKQQNLLRPGINSTELSRLQNQQQALLHVLQQRLQHELELQQQHTTSNGLCVPTHTLGHVNSGLATTVQQSSSSSHGKPDVDGSQDTVAQKSTKGAPDDSGTLRLLRAAKLKPKVEGVCFDKFFKRWVAKKSGTKKVYFPVHRYGFDEAYRLAVEARQVHLHSPRNGTKERSVEASVNTSGRQQSSRTLQRFQAEPASQRTCEAPEGYDTAPSGGDNALFSVECCRRFADDFPANHPPASRSSGTSETAVEGHGAALDPVELKKRDEASPSTGHLYASEYAKVNASLNIISSKAGDVGGAHLIEEETSPHDRFSSDGRINVKQKERRGSSSLSSADLLPQPSNSVAPPVAQVNKGGADDEFESLTAGNSINESLNPGGLRVDGINPEVDPIKALRVADSLAPYPTGIRFDKSTFRWFSIYRHSSTGAKRAKTFTAKMFGGCLLRAYAACIEFSSRVRSEEIPRDLSPISHASADMAKANENRTITCNNHRHSPSYEGRHSQAQRELPMGPSPHGKEADTEESIRALRLMSCQQLLDLAHSFPREQYIFYHKRRHYWTVYLEGCSKTFSVWRHGMRGGYLKAVEYKRSILSEAKGQKILLEPIDAHAEQRVASDSVEPTTLEGAGLRESCQQQQLSEIGILDKYEGDEDGASDGSLGIRETCSLYTGGGRFASDEIGGPRRSLRVARMGKRRRIINGNSGGIDSGCEEDGACFAHQPCHDSVLAYRNGRGYPRICPPERCLNEGSTANCDPSYCCLLAPHGLDTDFETPPICLPCLPPETRYLLRRVLLLCVDSLESMVMQRLSYSFKDRINRSLALQRHRQVLADAAVWGAAAPRSSSALECVESANNRDYSKPQEENRADHGDECWADVAPYVHIFWPFVEQLEIPECLDVCIACSILDRLHRLARQRPDLYLDYPVICEQQRAKGPYSICAEGTSDYCREDGILV